MHHTSESPGSILRGPWQLLSDFIAVSAVLTVLALLLVVSGVSSPGDSAGHSHLFLTEEAAINHTHSGEHEPGVVSFGGHQVDHLASSIPVLVTSGTLISASLTTHVLPAGPEPAYQSPVSAALERPPQTV